jgi:hypothetical protein
VNLYKGFGQVGPFIGDINSSGNRLQGLKMSSSARSTTILALVCKQKKVKREKAVTLGHMRWTSFAEGKRKKGKTITIRTRIRANHQHTLMANGGGRRKMLEDILTFHLRSLQNYADLSWS